VQVLKADGGTVCLSFGFGEVDRFLERPHSRDQPHYEERITLWRTLRAHECAKRRGWTASESLSAAHSAP
jgi:hypothetical protein